MAPEPLLRSLVGSILRTRREAQGRTLRDVAVAACVSVPYLSEIERGRKEASSEVLSAVSSALGMRLVDLLDDARRELVGPATVLDLTASAVGSAHHRDRPMNGSAPQALLRAA